MARGTTKKIAAAINKPGQKAATALASALQEQREEARQTLLKAKGTRSQYTGHLEWGRWFLTDVVEQKRTAQAEGTHSQADGESDIDGYSRAFDIIPNRYSASALELFLVQKGLMEGWSLSTMWGIFSAFKDMWKNATPHKYYSKGETYCGPYHCDEGTGVVTGNPALSAAAQDMMEVLKNNEGAEGGSRNHALAMTIEDMQKLMAWSYSQCPDGIVSHIRQSIEGRSTLDVADVILAQQHLMVRAFSTTGITIWTWNFELTKIKRKDIVWNCQGRPPYGIPFNLVSLVNRKGWQQKGEIDGTLEGHEYEVYTQPKTPEIYTDLDLRRGWADSQVPAIASTEVVQGISLCSHPSESAGHYLQYVGGVDTLIRYLLDELTRYEKNHWDALCPIPREGDKSFNGDHILTAPITAAETRELKMSFDRKLNHLSGKHSRGAAKKTAPIPSIGIPDLPHGQEAWLAAVKQWEDPAASIGGKALKDWPEEWYTGPMHTITGVKRNICKVIAIEFYRLQQDHQVFLEAYPEATRSVKPLFDAIQRQREGHGEITGRASKNGHPEVRASSSR
ncbi:hypothetical protein EDB19DRAFT_1835760 [Suillus lakei]|nr:hypothetical protein EDB19DRAFT_1835760 [Suillus lakei]